MSEGYEYTLHNRVLTFDGLLCMSRFGPVQNSYATWNCGRWRLARLRAASSRRVTSSAS